MNIENKRVIVYVSHPTVLEITTFRLEMIGIDAVGVATDEEMTEAIAQEPPSAVLIDLDLQDSQGLYWIEKIAADENTSHIPIMCLSVQGDLGQAETAFKAGARGFLVAPYDPILLESKLLDLLENAELAAAERQTTESTG